MQRIHYLRSIILGACSIHDSDVDHRNHYKALSTRIPNAIPRIFGAGDILYWYRSSARLPARSQSTD